MLRSTWARRAACCLLFLLTTTALGQETAYRPPSVPLVANNPMFSIWSNADKLTDDVTRHWTRKPHALTSIIRVDGKNFRLMGKEPAAVEAMPQTSVQVLPTRTIYQFANASVQVTLTFLTPALPDDVDVLSRPLTYLTWYVKSADGQPHAVSVLFAASSALAVDAPMQKVTWERAKVTGLNAVRVGSVDQAYVVRNGDDSRIDWGYAYIAASSEYSTACIADAAAVTTSFTDDGKLPADDTRTGRAVSDGDPTLALTLDFGKVAAEPVLRRAMIAYDDIYAVDYFGKKRPGYWRRNAGMDGEKLLAEADSEYPTLLAKCMRFDTNLMADLTKVGGADYAYICALAYRQALAGCGIAADANGQPCMFTKENTSNGNMGTVDVLFPMDPVWVLLSPTLAKATIAPVFQFAQSPMWKLPYAPHDLGEYPVAFARTHDNGTKDNSEAMPVEESGNLIILADAICQEEGSTTFIEPYWPSIVKWVKYLEESGKDPSNQLSTDDFLGPMAHNGNLAVKAIVGLGAYADMARMRGDKATADRYFAMARADAKNWMKMAGEGDHYKLGFDRKNSWQQVYNLVWDKVLNLNVFPPEVAEKEIAFYKTKLNKYGLPLDNRASTSKSDWTVWTASLANNQADFEMLIHPLVDYLNETTDRVPFQDGYNTDSAKTSFFHARPVIGGVFMRMLTDKPMWQKWSSMDHEKTGLWAPTPLPPVITEVVPTSRNNPIIWKYTTSDPGGDFAKPDFNDSAWKSGPAGFGQGGPPIHARTKWDTDDIWIRREFMMPPGDMTKLRFYCFHDEDVEIYINGVLAGAASGYNTGYQAIDFKPAGMEALKPGANNVIAVHCHQTVGGQFIDVGISRVTDR
jgi:hypothetical protein